MTDQEIRDLVNRAYDAFNRADYDTNLALATDDVEIVTVAFGETVRGKDAFRQWQQRWKTAAPDGRVQIVSQVIGPDAAVNECLFLGTNTGPLESPMGPLPPTGKSFSSPFIEVWRFRDGKVASLHNYADTLTLLTQLGLAPLPAAASS
ncbi:MAG TPA: nuclear transport factor 2 family protein [Chloroflexota bacterium]|nr:nuclear transport factor 2 family protein [Chloroflexota bacterium]